MGPIFTLFSSVFIQECIYVLDTEMFSVGMLRPMQTVDLAKTGDAEKRMILAEYGLIVKNEAASGAVYDLTHT